MLMVVADRIGAPKETPSAVAHHQSVTNEAVDEREKGIAVEDHDVLGGSSEMHNNIFSGPAS
jgi:hypothetical protein